MVVTVAKLLFALEKPFGALDRPSKLRFFGMTELNTAVQSLRAVMISLSKLFFLYSYGKNTDV